eukprot:COSAG06_NODE_344_length_17074_cov_116.626510_10_plen_94_part_00
MDSEKTGHSARARGARARGVTRKQQIDLLVDMIKRISHDKSRRRKRLQLEMDALNEGMQAVQRLDVNELTAVAIDTTGDGILDAIGYGGGRAI